MFIYLIIHSPENTIFGAIFSTHLIIQLPKATKSEAFLYNHPIMDFPKLPPELLQMLFEHMDPWDLLGLVEASPRCLRILESFGSARLQRLFERTMSGTRDKEIIHFHRPVTGLNALISLITASDASRDVLFILRWKTGTTEAMPKFDNKSNKQVRRCIEGDHPLSIERVDRTSDGFFDAMRKQRCAYLECIKGALLEHYTPFFDAEGLATINQQWDRDHRKSEELTCGIERYSDALPQAFGCDVDINGLEDGVLNGVRVRYKTPLYTLKMKASRDVVWFTVQVHLEPARDGDGGTETEDTETEDTETEDTKTDERINWHKMLCEMGVIPGLIEG